MMQKLMVHIMQIKQARFKTSMLRSNLCDFIDAYIVVKGIITADGAADRSKSNRKTVLENCALFTCYISNINDYLKDHAEGLDIVMSGMI